MLSRCPGRGAVLPAASLPACSPVYRCRCDTASLVGGSVILVSAAEIDDEIGKSVVSPTHWREPVRRMRDALGRLIGVLTSFRMISVGVDPILNLSTMVVRSSSPDDSFDDSSESELLFSPSISTSAAAEALPSDFLRFFLGFLLSFLVVLVLNKKGPARAVPVVIVGDRCSALFARCHEPSLFYGGLQVHMGEHLTQGIGTVPCAVWTISVRCLGEFSVTLPRGVLERVVAYGHLWVLQRPLSCSQSKFESLQAGFCRYDLFPPESSTNPTTDKGNKDRRRRQQITS